MRCERYNGETMSVYDTIETKIRVALEPTHLEVIDESSMHNVPPGTESHFRLLIVSEHFVGLSRVQRHQAVYGTLAEQMAGPVHALGLNTLTPDEFEEHTKVVGSPPCLGGDGTMEAR